MDWTKFEKKMNYKGVMGLVRKDLKSLMDEEIYNIFFPPQKNKKEKEWKI